MIENMPRMQTSRLLALLAGLGLLLFGGTSSWLTRQQFQSVAGKAWCRAGFCPDEFTLASVLLLEQQARMPGGSQQVLPLLQRALLQDNASAYRWTDLGTVEMDLGDPTRARYCFDQALRAAPHSPVILFRAANFDWQTGDAAGTLSKLATVLADPQLSDLYDGAFLTYSRLDVPMRIILAMGVPAQPLPASRFLDFEIRRRNAAAADAIWSWMQEHRLGTDAAAGEYCTFLIDNQRPELGAETWRTFAGHDGPYRRQNWLFNGGFEAPPRPSPFDWHIESTADVIAERAEMPGREGSVLQLRFLGRDNSLYNQTYQYAAVPAGAWVLKADVKTEDLPASSGLQLHVSGAVAANTLDVWSDEVSGTTEWTARQLRFHSGPGTRLLRIQVVRQPSVLFDERVRGSAWVDNVELTPG